jgi:hypothetical protein
VGGVPRFSGIAGAGGFINLLSGKNGTKNGSPTFIVDGISGPMASTLVSSNSYTFAGQSAANDVAGTIAAIVTFTAYVATSFFLTTSGAGSTGISFGATGTSNTYGVVFPGGGFTIPITPAFVPTNNVPYFIGVSFLVSGGTTGTGNVVVRELLTGRVCTASNTVSTTGPLAPNGTYMVGNGPAGFQGAHGNLAAVMFSTAVLGLSQLVQFSTNPWSFWYPN